MTGSQTQKFKSIFSQSTGVIFAGRNGLDFLELRMGALRIPEISLRIREAQQWLDTLDVEPVDLIAATSADDDTFFRNIKIKSLLAAIVQVGLYDRLLKSQKSPDVLIGNSNGDSALLVCVGQMSFEQLIKESAALQTLVPRENQTIIKKSALSVVPQVGEVQLLPLPGHSAPLVSNVNASGTAEIGDIVSSADTFGGIAGLPSLAGLSLTEYRAFTRAEDGAMLEIGQPVMDLKRLISEVAEHQGVCRFINVGPALALPTSEYELIAESAGADEVTIIDSIDLDPMLSWFWRQMRPAVGFAN